MSGTPAVADVTLARWKWRAPAAGRGVQQGWVCSAVTGEPNAAGVDFPPEDASCLSKSLLECNGKGSAGLLVDHAAAALCYPGAGVLGCAHCSRGSWPGPARGPCTAGQWASEAWLGLEPVLCGGGVHGHGATVRGEGKVTLCVPGADEACAEQGMQAAWLNLVGVRGPT